ncbi:MAG: glycerophosphodiester phosphodiesterase [Myxococcales bacterium]|nr:glycerophosphodiester phosphodiesterase [Myxococcales bacterium]
MSASRLPDAFRRRADRPAIVGHRGARGEHPENTLESFAAAKAQRADAIELDVRPTRDGVLVVFHDPDLWRLAGDRRPADEVTHRELAAMTGVEVPTLEQALDFARSAGLGVNVEIKRDVKDRDGLVDAVARVLDRWDPHHDVIVSSFDPWMLRDHRARCAGRAHALLVHRSAYQELALLAARLFADGVHVHTMLTRSRIMPRVAKAGFVSVWTVNDLVIARRAFDLGADALITDEPGRIREGFERSDSRAIREPLLTS